MTNDTRVAEDRAADQCRAEAIGVRCHLQPGHKGDHICYQWRDGVPLKWTNHD